MGLNSIGVYGFLARAHIEHALIGDVQVSNRAADIQARIDVQSNSVADLDKRIAQIDAAIDEATKRGRTNGAMSLAADQRKTRADLVAVRTKEANVLAGLQVERAAIDGERKTVEADNGPVRYFSQLIGTTDATTMRYFILAVALLLDPAAVLLLLAATARRASQIQWDRLPVAGGES